MRWRWLLCLAVLGVSTLAGCNTALHSAARRAETRSYVQARAAISPLLSAPDQFIYGYDRTLDPSKEDDVVRRVINQLRVSLDLVDVRNVEATRAAALPEIGAQPRDYGGVSLTRLPGKAELVTLVYRTRPSPKQFVAVVRSIRVLKDVRYAEPNYYQFGAAHGSHTSASSTPPRCALATMENSGDAAWSVIDLDSSASAGGAVVGIVDSGIYSGHRDLPVVMTGSTGDADTYGHGTYLAGVMVAVRSNAMGVQGMAPGAKITARQFLDSHGRGDTSKAKLYIEDAIKDGAQIVLLSWGTTADSQALRDAIHDHPNVLFVAAAGNFHRKLSEVPIFPAYYSSMTRPEPNVISVGAVNIANSKLTAFSNLEADVEAPGDGPELTKRTCSTVLNNEYGRLAGTSVAAAFVAGEAALLVSKEMGKATNPWKATLTDSQVIELRKLIKDNQTSNVIDIKMALNAVR